MNLNLEEMTHLLLHKSITYRRRGFKKLREIFSYIESDGEVLKNKTTRNSLREVLWSAIQNEQNHSFQAEIIDFAIKKYKPRALNKLVKLNELGFIHLPGQKIIAIQFTRYSNNNNLEYLKSSIDKSRIGLNILHHIITELSNIEFEFLFSPNIWNKLLREEKHLSTIIFSALNLDFDFQFLSSVEFKPILHQPSRYVFLTSSLEIPSNPIFDLQVNLIHLMNSINLSDFAVGKAIISVLETSNFIQNHFVSQSILILSQQDRVKLESSLSQLFERLSKRNFDNFSIFIIYYLLTISKTNPIIARCLVNLLPQSLLYDKSREYGFSYLDIQILTYLGSKDYLLRKLAFQSLSNYSGDHTVFDNHEILDKIWIQIHKSSEFYFILTLGSDEFKNYLIRIVEENSLQLSKELLSIIQFDDVVTSLHDFIRANLRDILLISMLDNDPNEENRIEYIANTDLSSWVEYNKIIGSYKLTKSSRLVISYIVYSLSLILNLVKHQDHTVEEKINELLDLLIFIPRDGIKLLAKSLESNRRYHSLCKILLDSEPYTYLVFKLSYLFQNKIDVDEMPLLIQSIPQWKIHFLTVLLIQIGNSEFQVLNRVLLLENHMIKRNLLDFIENKNNRKYLSLSNEYLSSIFQVLSRVNDPEIRTKAFHYLKKFD